MDSASALVSSALLAPESMLRWIDSLVASLTALRSDVSQKDQASLLRKIERARDGRQRWWRERQAANWANELASSVETPKASEVFGRMLGFGGRKTKKTK
jgi:hypothetical protein